MGRQCGICGNSMLDFDQAMILGKYKTMYWRCLNCGFIQTDNPYWLNEAYSSAIAYTDIGLVSRNYNFAIKSCAIFKICLSNAESYLDFGGGIWYFCTINER